MYTSAAQEMQSIKIGWNNGEKAGDEVYKCAGEARSDRPRGKALIVAVNPREARRYRPEVFPADNARKSSACKTNSRLARGVRAYSRFTRHLTAGRPGSHQFPGSSRQPLFLRSALPLNHSRGRIIAPEPEKRKAAERSISGINR